MIASVFSKTRPLNYLIITVSVLISFLLYSFSISYFAEGGIKFFYGAGKYIILLSSCLLLNFIVLKNNLTNNDNYALFLFFVFILCFPSIFQNNSVIIANLLVLMAMRRIVSMKSMISTKEKIFDATFWILLATFFEFWSILFLILVFYSIIVHGSQDYKNWLIPFVALFTVLVLFFTLNLLLDNALLNDLQNSALISLEFTYFESIYQHIALAVFSSIGVLFFASSISSIKSRPLNLQSSHKEILLSFLIGIAIYLFSANKNNGCLFFSLVPMSVMGANLIEQMESEFFKNLILYVFLGMGLFFFVAAL